MTIRQLEVIDVPCDHLSICSEPHVRIVAAELKARLDRFG